MNIGFHYFLTRVLAEKAGFIPADAQTIAYACQHVDDATAHTEIIIHNLPNLDYKRIDQDVFDPICTAHKGIENIRFAFENIRDTVLRPFHFIPKGWDENRSHYDFKTAPEVTLAVQLLNQALENLGDAPPDGEPHTAALIKLGIALHSYQDTFAHQRFSARDDETENGVDDVRILKNHKKSRLPSFAKGMGFVGLEIGHGLLGHFPDYFNTQVSYIDGEGNAVQFETNRRFMLAARKTYDRLREHTGSPDNWEAISRDVERCMQKNRRRMCKWLKTFQSIFPKISFDYHENDWKDAAIEEIEDGEYEFRGCLKWFRFHQAALDQRKFVIDQMEGVPE